MSEETLYSALAFIEYPLVALNWTGCLPEYNINSEKLLFFTVGIIFSLPLLSIFFL